MFSVAHANQRPEADETRPKQSREDWARKQAKKERLEAALEEGLQGTFPASDPIAVTEPARERPT